MSPVDYRLAALRLASPLRSGSTFTRLTFRGGAHHNAADTAALWLEASGFSVGLPDSLHNKRAVLFGSFLIPTWTTIIAGDLAGSDLFGIDGIVRDDPVNDISIVEIWPDADPMAIAAALDRDAA